LEEIRGSRSLRLLPIIWAIAIQKRLQPSPHFKAADSESKPVLPRIVKPLDILGTVSGSDNPSS
jgi:hypothetical protein